MSMTQLMLESLVFTRRVEDFRFPQFFTVISVKHSSGMRFVMTMLFNSSSRWLSHSGPITQSVFSASWDEFVPLDGTSAGLLSVGQYLQLSTGRRLLISLTLFCTDSFHSLSMPLIQQSATSESLQQVIFLTRTSHFRAPSTAVTNLASMTAAKSSNLGIVRLLSGATLVLDATNFREAVSTWR